MASNSRQQTAHLMSPYELSPACMCHPPVAPLPPPMPMPGMPIGAFVDMLYRFALHAGYHNDRVNFEKDFADALNGVNNNKYAIIVKKPSYNDFPAKGVENAIYIDTSENQAYYWQGDGYYVIMGSNSYLDEYIDNRVDMHFEELMFGNIIDGGNAQTE